MRLRILTVMWIVSLSLACSDDPKRRLGATCDGDSQCESGLCLQQMCVDPNGDLDEDGIPNGEERASGGGGGGGDVLSGGDVLDASTGDPGTGTATGTGTGSAGDLSSGGDAIDSAGPTPKRIYDVTFTPNIDVGACRAELTWQSQNLQVDDQGKFDEVWSHNDPNTVHIFGTVDASAFSASFVCVNGAGSTTLQAARSGNEYVGSFAFGQSSGSFHVNPPAGF